MASRKVPCLPGYSIETDVRSSFPRRQDFRVNNGLRVIRDCQLNGNLRQQSFDAPVQKEENTTNKPKHVAPPTSSKEAARSAPVSRLPSWLEFSNRVLRFYAYFKEGVHESATETFRVRKCILLFYLEDHSLQISEEQQTNSGMKQGLFLQRHKVPLEGTGREIMLQDFGIGSEISIYGRVYRVYDADGYTRNFYRSYVQELPGAEDVPVDDFESQQRTKHFQHHHKQHLESLAQLSEAAHGKPTPQSLKKTRKMLANFRKVLRFWARMPDPASQGEVDRFVLHYFLADDTIEVNRVLDNQAGLDVSAPLIKRQKVPKVFVLSNTASAGQDGETDPNSFYSPADLRIGKTINVFGRRLQLVEADEFTKKYYRDEYGLSSADVEALICEKAVKETNVLPIPPHNGFGSEEDTLSSLGLRPRKPVSRFDESLRGESLRFQARLVSSLPDNEERMFFISFHLMNQTVSVYEKSPLNSGFVGGKFLERSRIKNPNTGSLFTTSDFIVGKELCINSHRFELLRADARTEAYMRSSSIGRARANVKQVFTNLKHMLRSRSSDTKRVFRDVVHGSSISIDAEKMGEILSEAGWNLSQDDVRGVFDQFKHNEAGQITFNEFADELK